MLIIIDKKIPRQAKDKLASFGKLMELETEKITYDAISGHPDIFFHQSPDDLFVSPNLPDKYLEILKEEGIPFVMGEQGVGEKYPASASFNAVSTKNLLIHNFRNTDAAITRRLDDADLIHVDQGYTRCNLIAFDDKHFISSDEGIDRILKRFDKDSLLVSNEGIELKGFDHGFFGGCCGIYHNKLFVLGSLDEHPQNQDIEEFVARQGHYIIELYDGPLFDGGSIIFLQND
jgi:hypothetical protein